MKKKVSFDFDNTLGVHEVEEYAIELVKRGFEVWIVTSRYDSIDKYSEKDKKDWQIKNLPQAWNNLFIVADIVGIKDEHIQFTNFQPKSEFFKKNKDFLFHLDDDIREWKRINEDTEVTGVNYGKNKGWRDICEYLIS